MKHVLGSKVQLCGMQVRWSHKLGHFPPTSTLSSAPSSSIETGTPGNRGTSEEPLDILLRYEHYHRLMGPISALSQLQFLMTNLIGYTLFKDFLVPQSML